MLQYPLFKCRKGIRCSRGKGAFIFTVTLRFAKFVHVFSHLPHPIHHVIVTRDRHLPIDASLRCAPLAMTRTLLRNNWPATHDATHVSGGPSFLLLQRMFTICFYDKYA